MVARIPYGSTMELSRTSTLQLPGLSRQARHIHFTQIFRTSPLISLGVLFDDRCTITLKSNKFHPKKSTTNNKSHQEQSNRNVGSSSGDTTTRKFVENTMLAQTTKPELPQYIHATLFSLTTESLIKAIKLDFLKTCSGLT